MLVLARLCRQVKWEAAAADQLRRANQFPCTIPRACRLCWGHGQGSSRNRTPLPTGDPWRPSDGPRVGLVELLQEGRVRKVGVGDPCAVLQPVTHPVHYVVETPPTAMDRKDPVDLPDQIAALEGTRRRGSRGRRRQVAGGHRLDLGNVEDWVDLEGGGKVEAEG